MKHLSLAILTFAGAALAQAPPPVTTQIPAASAEPPRAVAPTDQPVVQPVSGATSTMGAGPATELPLKKTWSRSDRAKSARSMIANPSGQRPEFDNGGPN